MKPAGIVDVDLAALRRNYATLARAAAPGETAAVVKSNAYGLGIERVSHCLYTEGCRDFFVATAGEGVVLRSFLPESRVYVLEGLAGSSCEEFVAANMIPVLNTPAEYREWGSTGPAAVHIDTGMNRLGFGPDEIDELKSHSGAAVDVRLVMTHLACGDTPQHKLNRLQLDRFNRLRQFWPGARTSIASSAANLRSSDDFKSDLARPGVALFGGNPFDQVPSPVEAVVTLRARIVQVRTVRAGQTIGYGATFTADRDMRTAIVGIGYSDGYMRSLGNCGIAEVNGRRVPVVGRVSMDLLCLDVSGIDGVAADDWAVMIGSSISLEELAALAGTINYELLTALGPRLQRVYHGEETVA